MQGSSNFSYLTKRGQAQADTTRILVRQPLFSGAHLAHLWRRHSACDVRARALSS